MTFLWNVLVASLCFLSFCFSVSSFFVGHIMKNFPLRWLWTPIKVYIYMYIYRISINAYKIVTKMALGIFILSHYCAETLLPRMLWNLKFCAHFSERCDCPVIWNRPLKRVVTVRLLWRSIDRFVNLCTLYCTISISTCMIQENRPRNRAIQSLLVRNERKDLWYSSCNWRGQLVLQWFFITLKRN